MSAQHPQNTDKARSLIAAENGSPPPTPHALRPSRNDPSPHDSLDRYILNSSRSSTTQANRPSENGPQPRQDSKKSPLPPLGSSNSSCSIGPAPSTRQQPPHHSPPQFPAAETPRMTSDGESDPHRASSTHSDNYDGSLAPITPSPIGNAPHS